MVLALEGSHGLNVLREKDAERWLSWYRGNRSDEPEPRGKLANFLDLYRKIKDDKFPMKRYGDSQQFVPTGTQDQSIKRLNDLRNEFVHFTPKHWRLELGGLALMRASALSITSVALSFVAPGEASHTAVRWASSAEKTEDNISFESKARWRGEGFSVAVSIALSFLGDAPVKVSSCSPSPW